MYACLSSSVTPDAQHKPELYKRNSDAAQHLTKEIKRQRLRHRTITSLDQQLEIKSSIYKSISCANSNE